MAPKRKYQGEGYRLKPEEKAFAEENHGLIFKFLKQKKLDPSEYYDMAAEGYLIAVIKFYREERLKKYRFSTIAYKSMYTVISNEWEGRRRYQGHIAFSLDQEMENGDIYSYYIPDPVDHFRQIEQGETLKGLLGQIMPLITVDQREILIMKLEGFKIHEIMKKQKRSFVDYFRDEAVVRDKVTFVLNCPEDASI